ncbi:MAG: DUF4973 domain-containing protein [Prevotella sp.]|jgi:hypothetical protein|nr:DUF4973 domain-containing protein [Prevotella sp.]
MKKNIMNLFLLPFIIIAMISCNDEWTDELYTHYVSFKAPLNSKGVTDVYVKYREDSTSTYQLPMIVSGTTTNPKNLYVKVALDLDTLNTLNYERFQNRHDLYFTALADSLYNIPNFSVTIPSGSRQGLLPINFTFKGIDMFYKWVLPLTITDEASANYQAHPRKNYKKALLRVIPFNDYSGVYQTTAMNIYFKGTNTDALVINSRTAFVVDENSIFFYAGATDEDDKNRRTYKIVATFNKDSTLNMHAEDEKIDFQLLSIPKYTVEENMDDVLPYLKHRYITIKLSYIYNDITSVPGVSIGYQVEGTMTMERKINTQIPDEDQAIQW